MSWKPGDLLLKHSQHVEELRTALSTAESMVFVASAFLDSAVLDGEPREWLLAALRRGVQVQMLWGYAARHGQQEEKAATNWLRRLRRDADSFGHNLRFSSEPTESHAKLLIYDPPGGACAVVGSFNWLSSPLRAIDDDPPARNISLRLRHPQLVSTLAHTAASLWMSSRAALLSDAPDRLVISSYNFLSADPFHTAVKAREVGILIHSDIACENVRAAVIGEPPQ